MFASVLWQFSGSVPVHVLLSISAELYHGLTMRAHAGQKCCHTERKAIFFLFYTTAQTQTLRLREREIERERERDR